MSGWPGTGNFNTTHVDSGGDSPAEARPAIKAAMDDLATVIAGRGAANGVAPLNASSKVPASNLPRGDANGVAPLGSDARVPLASLPTAMPVCNGITAYQTAGSYTWTVPAGVTRVLVEAWGAGGGGGWSSSGAHGGGGGAGGGAIKLWDVAPGDELEIVVGSGGAGGVGPSNDDGADGGNTTVTLLGQSITGNGGGGGQASPPFGGSGGVAANGDVNLQGGSSMTGVENMGGLGGSNARSGAAPGSAGYGFGGGGYGAGGAALAISGKDGGVLIIW